MIYHVLEELDSGGLGTIWNDLRMIWKDFYWERFGRTQNDSEELDLEGFGMTFLVWNDLH